MFIYFNFLFQINFTSNHNDTLDNYDFSFQNVIRFWLEKGVDGFRVDAVPYLFEDPELKDEPLSGDPNSLPTEAGYLVHDYTQNLPGTYDMVQQWREVVDEKSKESGETK